MASIDREELQLLAARLECAVETLQHLPVRTATQPAGTRSALPEMIRKSWFTVERTRQESPALQSAEAIDDLDRLAMLLWKLTPRHRQLLWARACRVRWVELCRRQRDVGLRPSSCADGARHGGAGGRFISTFGLK